MIAMLGRIYIYIALVEEQKLIIDLYNYLTTPLQGVPIKSI